MKDWDAEQDPKKLRAAMKRWRQTAEEYKEQRDHLQVSFDSYKREAEAMVDQVREFASFLRRIDPPERCHSCGGHCDE